MKVAQAHSGCHGVPCWDQDLLDKQILSLAQHQILLVARGTAPAATTGITAVSLHMQHEPLQYPAIRQQQSCAHMQLLRIVAVMHCGFPPTSVRVEPAKRFPPVTATVSVVCGTMCRVTLSVIWCCSTGAPTPVC